MAVVVLAPFDSCSCGLRAVAAHQGNQEKSDTEMACQAPPITIACERARRCRLCGNPLRRALPITAHALYRAHCLPYCTARVLCTRPVLRVLHCNTIRYV